ncbi:hypothetical protein [Rossellomorea aquimaris]|uniref:Uncharacterized protein n=1 Tax=Rossellomorea aquimaris TaxID=189382 RepID=A0A5D4TKZ6_9BACI|nr:hypothetical protein [Rossellomorea aquimaris]TYS75132.1 hypothetical protein FZC80_18325 [Rossellomorea aquimaris]
MERTLLSFLMHRSKSPLHPAWYGYSSDEIVGLTSFPLGLTVWMKNLIESCCQKHLPSQKSSETAAPILGGTAFAEIGLLLAAITLTTYQFYEKNKAAGP